MKSLLPLALLLAASPAFSQTIKVVEPDTPPPLTTFFQEFGSDGSAYTLTNAGGKEHWFNLPFGLDFSGGWQVVVGKRTADMDGTFTEIPAYGLELYGLKRIGGDGAYVRIGLRGLFDGTDGGVSSFSRQRLRGAATLTIGFRAKA